MSSTDTSEKPYDPIENAKDLSIARYRVTTEINPLTGNRLNQFTDPDHLQTADFAVAGRLPGMCLYKMALEHFGEKDEEKKVLIEARLKPLLNFGDNPNGFINPLTAGKQEHEGMLKGQTNPETDYINNPRKFLETFKVLCDTLFRYQHGRDENTELDRRSGNKRMSEKERSASSNIESMVLRLDFRKFKELGKQGDKLPEVPLVVRGPIVATDLIAIIDSQNIDPNKENPDKPNPLKNLGEKIKKVGGDLRDRINGRLNTPINLEGIGPKVATPPEAPDKPKGDPEKDKVRNKIKIGFGTLMAIASLCRGLSIGATISLDRIDLDRFVKGAPGRVENYLGNNLNKWGDLFLPKVIVPTEVTMTSEDPLKADAQMNKADKVVTPNVPIEPGQSKGISAIPDKGINNEQSISQENLGKINKEIADKSIDIYVVKKGDMFYRILQDVYKYSDAQINDPDILKTLTTLNLVSSQSNLEAYMDEWQANRGGENSLVAVTTLLKLTGEDTNLTPEQFYSLDHMGLSDLATRIREKLLTDPSIIMNSDPTQIKASFENIFRLLNSGDRNTNVYIINFLYIPAKDKLPAVVLEWKAPNPSQSEEVFGNQQ